MLSYEEDCWALDVEAVAESAASVELVGGGVLSTLARFWTAGSSEGEGSRRLVLFSALEEEGVSSAHFFCEATGEFSSDVVAVVSQG